MTSAGRRAESMVRLLMPAVCAVAFGCARGATTAVSPSPAETPAPVAETPAPRLDAEPLLRVGLVVQTQRVTIEARGDVDVTASGRPLYRMNAGSQIHVTTSTEGLHVTGGAADAYERIVFEPRDRTRHVVVNGSPYRGVVEVFASGDRATVVNVVGVEDYLLGVVPVEMGNRRSDEWAALQAQAVASRTYALRNRGKFESEGYDLRASVSDQAYRGVSRETEDATRATRETTGQVLVYDGRLIAAFFHSTCGEVTASPDEAFRSVTSVAYLQPVSDESGDGYYGDISPHFRWTVEWGGTELLETLRRTVPRVLGVDAGSVDTIRDVYVRRWGPSGRAAEVRIVVGSGEIPVFGPDVRSVFVTPQGRPLASNAVRFSATYEGARVDRLTVDGMGYGHGVGLCQWGAVGRARAGQDYRRILTTYYPGATIERWY